MQLTFAQYTSPHKGPVGYRWLKTGGYEKALARFTTLLAQIDWERPNVGAICVLPSFGIGIVFRKIAGLPDALGRDKTTTNAGVFSLKDAAAEGLNGIWQLPFLSDPAEENRKESIIFHPSVSPLPVSLSDIAELPSVSTDTIVVIGNDNTCRKVVGGNAAENCHRPSKPAGSPAMPRERHNKPTTTGGNMLENSGAENS